VRKFRITLDLYSDLTFAGWTVTVYDDQGEAVDEVTGLARDRCTPEEALELLLRRVRRTWGLQLQAF
jgi:methyl coenzyme M reductase subunit C